jgi:hypothetical protein
MSPTKIINKFKNLKYSISRIKTLQFFINEHWVINDPTKEMKIEFAQTFGVNFDADEVDFRLRIYFFYLEKPSEIITEIVVQNLFKVLDLKSYSKDKNIVTLPPELIIAIVSMSISHSRALLCENLSGTLMQNYILPITNANEVSKQFYPMLFDEKGKMKKETTFNLTPKLPIE